MESRPILSDSGRTKSTREGSLTKSERKTSKIPSSIFLALAGGAFALSLGLAVSRRKKSWANFTGLWVPTILLLGIYDRIVNTQASNKEEPYSILH
ncbi:MAG: hypothetical protein ACXVLQ_10735 [Bacteriovorax sp.]